MDHARRHNLKRGAGVKHISLEETAAIAQGVTAIWWRSTTPCRRLLGLDPRKARVVELRFFGDLSVEETAQVLKVSEVTVMRDWSTARAWLYREMGP